MFNLCNDVLNKERRNLFPKIPTLDNKLSLYSLIFLKQQNPYKFYKSFYDKILMKTNNNLNKNTKKPFKQNSFLSLLSKSQNYFYSVPIKYTYKPQKLEKKNKESQKNNDLNNIMAINKEHSLINKSSFAMDLLHNKNLKIIHEYLVKNNDSNNLSKKKRNQSCKDIYMESEKNESESNNSIINDKVSRGQQTIYNNAIINYFENKNYNEIEKIEKNNGFKTDIKYKNEKLIKYRIKKEDKKKKFTINFEKRNSAIYYKKKNNSCTNKINIIWRNLRRPITMKFDCSFKLH